MFGETAALVVFGFVWWSLMFWHQGAWGSDWGWLFDWSMGMLDAVVSGLVQWFGLQRYQCSDWSVVRRHELALGGLLVVRIASKKFNNAQTSYA